MISEASIQLGKALSTANIDEALTVALNNLLDCGHHNHIRTYSNGLPDKAHASIDILNFPVSLDSPECSIPTDPAHHFQKKDTSSGLAWIFEPNSRFGDITSYQPMARSYSENQISMSASNGRWCVFEPYRGFVAKFRRYARECFLLWVGFEPPSWVSDLSAALITASALFFIVHPSCMLANLTLKRLHVSINQPKPFLEICILMQNRMGGKLYMQL